MPRPSRAPRAVGAAAALLLAVAGAAAEPPLRGSQDAIEQPTTQPGAESNGPEADRAARAQELERLQAEQRAAAEAEERLKAEIAALGEDRRRLNQSLIDTAGRVRAVEGRISAAEGRLKSLDSDEERIQRSLAGRRAVIAEVLAVLQRIGRRPPPALLVRPEDALAAVRTAMLLGAVLPEMRAETEVLAADLTELVRLRGEIRKERDMLARDFAALAEERRRMTLLVEERQRRQTEAEKALAAERERAAALAKQVGSLQELIAKLEQAAAAARSQAQPAGPSRPGDSGRLTPAVAFASAKGALPLPVSGVRVREYGAPDGFGGTEKGMLVATRNGAAVTAPCDGWVVYAGPFRSYGQLLILNAGDGYHVLLAGMDRISVDLGQFVLTGEPVAVMGAGPQVPAAAAIGTSQPVLYVEFRKDGVPIDPSPWWAATESEKVRG